MEPLTSSSPPQAITVSGPVINTVQQEPPNFVVNAQTNGDLTVETDETGGQVSLSSSSKIDCAPTTSPFSYQVVFQLPGQLADPPLTWNNPTARPPWIEAPTIEGSSVKMTVYHCSSEQQSAQFTLVLSQQAAANKESKGAPSIVKVDPTIVNNPPIGSYR